MGVLVLVVMFMLSWYLGAFSQQPVAGVQGLPSKAGLLPAVAYQNTALYTYNLHFWELRVWDMGHRD